jgi:uncharacterized repeat protein (TIGR04138 family)
MMPEDLPALAKTTRYPLEAFVFVQRGLDFTVRREHGEPPPEADSKGAAQAVESKASRHVTGRQLCYGLRDFAVQQYGLLARAVLRHYRIYTCEDFGHIVFAMVEAGFMKKTDDDTLGDFAGVFDFAEAFAPKLQLSES